MLQKISLVGIIYLHLCFSSFSQTMYVVKDVKPLVFSPVLASTGYQKGYLGKRMEINLSKRLMQLNLDGILEPFRNRPGVQEWVGEHVGKFLHASSLQYKSSGDTALRRRIDYVAKSLIETQLPDGYLGTYLPKDYWTEWDVWSHKYNLIGLLAYYEISGYEPALEACKKMGTLLAKTFGTAEGQYDIVDPKHGTHMGMAPSSVLEPMVELYRYTGDKKFLEFCEYIVKSWEQAHGPRIISSLLKTSNVHKTANSKSYEMMSCLVGLLELYRVTGRENYLKVVQIAWEDIRTNRLYLHGSASFHEHFKDGEDFRPDGYYAYDKVYVGPGEGCVTVTWEQMNYRLFNLTGEQKYIEELEKLTYNSLMGAQSPQTGAVCYFVPLTGRKRYGEVSHGLQPDISCCASSIPRGIALLPEFIAGKMNNGFSINLYTPAKFNARLPAGRDSTDVSIDINTGYPSTGNVDIVVSTAKKSAFKLLLNVPKWCTDYKVQIGNERYTGQAGTFLEINRVWNNDWIKITMDMPYRSVADNNTGSNKLSIFRGPQMLVADKNISDVKRLPSGWFGDQLYSLAVLRNKRDTIFNLVPFADAGQTLADYNSLFEPFEFNKESPTPALKKYRDQLSRFRKEFGIARNMPEVKFFLFGMGNRKKYLYINGELKEAMSGKIIKKFQIKNVTIIPNEHRVNMVTTNGNDVSVHEDENGVYLTEGKRSVVLDGTTSVIVLPLFGKNQYSEILKVLHHEILINIVDSKPLPNFFVYDKPWRRDGAMMAMCLEKTGNISLIKDWVLSLDDPYDHNNGEDEPDNLGQTLVLLSYFTDKKHPLVNKILDQITKFEVKNGNARYINGRSDMHNVPVYQTKWLKEGLKKLGLADPYTIPKHNDDYASLYWWGYNDSYLKETKDAYTKWGHDLFPYIGWAADHFHGTKTCPISNRDYPLTWEIQAGKADYPGMKKINEQYALEKNSSPHTWHAAEVFLYLISNDKPSGYD